ncbi:MAG: heavy metal translocating P-type ATPase, partial [Alphaproteobacteria bacterium CG_4_10_14_0_8_um_filter_53_9]
MSLTESLLTPYIHTENDGTKRLMFMVEGVHCAGCMARLEGAIKPVKGVKTARLNLTTKRLVLEWVGPLSVAQAAIDAAAKAGYPLTPYNPEKQEDARTREEKALLRYLAVAGFAGANVMLLSVALWAGAEDSTRQLFQWLSAAIVLPALAYAGQPYFKAAWQALSHRRTSMEVPISIALLLTSSISLYDTLNGGRETYFESAIMLLFFLLIGRYLETRTRGRSHNAAEHLLGLQHTVATVQNEDGTATQLRAEDIPLGATVLCRQGERLAIDGILLSPTAYLDTSVLTGETLPRAVKKGETVQAGTLNTSGTILIKTTAAGKNTTLAEIARLTDTATTVKNKYTRLADRMAQSYAPLVHGLAFLTLSGGLWWGLGGHESITRAAAVLIVTCPCALALAVPTVHVAIMSKLLKNGVILKSGEALEKLAD